MGYNPHENFARPNDKTPTVHWMDKTVDSCFNEVYGAQASMLGSKAMKVEHQLPKELVMDNIFAKTCSDFGKDQTAGNIAWKNIEDKLNGKKPYQQQHDQLIAA